MSARAPEHVRSMDKAHSRAWACIMQTCLHQLTLHTYVMRESPRENGVKLEVFQHPGFGNVLGEWMSADIDVGGIFPVSAHYFHININIYCS